MSRSFAANQSYLSVDWGSPINWDHPLNRGLVGWWLNAPHWQGGTKWRDLANGYDGTLTSMDPSTDWVTSGSRQGGWGALDFGASDQSVQVSSFPTTTGSFTVSGWFQSTNNNNADREGIVEHSTGGNDGWRIQTGSVAAKGKLTFTLGGVADYSFTNLALVGDWQFFTVSVSGTTAVGYLDSETQSLTIGTLSGTPTKVIIGDINAFTGFSFLGKMDDIRIWNRNLSAREYALLYQQSIHSYPDMLRRWTRRAYSVPAAAGGATTIALTTGTFTYTPKDLTNLLALKLGAADLVMQGLDVHTAIAVNLASSNFQFTAKNVQNAVAIRLAAAGFPFSAKDVTVIGALVVDLANGTFNFAGKALDVSGTALSRAYHAGHLVLNRLSRRN